MRRKVAKNKKTEGVYFVNLLAAVEGECPRRGDSGKRRVHALWTKDAGCYFPLDDTSRKLYSRESV